MGGRKGVWCLRVCLCVCMWLGMFVCVEGLRIYAAFVPVRIRVCLHICTFSPLRKLRAINEDSENSGTIKCHIICLFETEFEICFRNMFGHECMCMYVFFLSFLCYVCVCMTVMCMLFACYVNCLNFVFFYSLDI